jgi:hypothetical protein
MESSRWKSRENCLFQTLSMQRALAELGEFPFLDLDGPDTTLRSQPQYCDSQPSKWKNLRIHLPHFVIECRYFKLGEEVAPQVAPGEA